VVLDADIRTGLDFAAVAMRDYRTAPAALKSEWAFWRETAPRYGFGRTELLPIKSTAEGFSKYVGKYIAKQAIHRLALSQEASGDPTLHHCGKSELGFITRSSLKAESPNHSFLDRS
jgi:hypothetical protein